MSLAPVHHRRITVDGIDTFYREAGPADAPVVLLPHGYPCSSYAYRTLITALGDRWRCIAPDMPGFGYTATPSFAERTGVEPKRREEAQTSALGTTRKENSEPPRRLTSSGWLTPPDSNPRVGWSSNSLRFPAGSCFEDDP
ncbi:MAG: alpha/beta fold hydrolase [Mycobacterium sp.]|uniref:alpha/beta fold hydrolase n=1 Tax=Mycobacterium sp. TaxID=1785 RepID=UPI00389A17D1